MSEIEIINIMKKEIVASKLLIIANGLNQSTRDKISAIINLLDLLKLNIQKSKYTNILCDISIMLNTLLKSVDEDIMESTYIKISNCESLKTSSPEIPDSDSSYLNYERNYELKFSDVVGNTIAKTSLYESIVLRFKLDLRVHSKIFSGIRGGCGNVIIYGPPGCGTNTCIFFPMKPDFF